MSELRYTYLAVLPSGRHLASSGKWDSAEQAEAAAAEHALRHGEVVEKLELLRGA